MGSYMSNACYLVANGNTQPGTKITHKRIQVIKSMQIHL